MTLSGSCHLLRQYVNIKIQKYVPQSAKYSMLIEGMDSAKTIIPYHSILDHPA